MLIAANKSRLINLGKAFGAGASYIVASAGRQELERTGARRNWFTGSHVVSGVTSKSAVPDGARHPVAYLQPLVAGGLSSRNEVIVTTTVGAATLAAGRNIDGSTTLTFTVPNAALQLVVSAIGSTSITFTVDGNLAGSLAATGSTSVTFTVGAATLGAISDLLGTAGITFTESATPRAIGHLAGDITPFTELSPQSLASAVWDRIVEAGFTAEEILRILAAHAAGSATGLEGSNPQFTGIDGVTLRIDGTYSAGTRTIDALNGD